MILPPRAYFSDDSSSMNQVVLKNASLTRQKNEKVELIFLWRDSTRGILRRVKTRRYQDVAPTGLVRFRLICASDLGSVSDHHSIFDIPCSIFIALNVSHTTQHQMPTKIAQLGFFIVHPVIIPIIVPDNKETLRLKTL